VRAFLEFAGPSTIKHISAWSGTPQRDLEPILAAIKAEPVAIDGLGDAFAAPGDIDAAHAAPLPLGIRLLAFEDNYLVNHGGPGAVTDPKHHAIEADIWGDDKPEPLGTANHILSRSIVIDGLVAGFWEVDPKANGAVWTTFDPPSKQVAAKIDELTDDIATFLLDDVGNARVFSLDTMELVQERANRIKKWAPKGAKKSSTKSAAKPKPRTVAARTKKPAAKSKSKKARA